MALHRRGLRLALFNPFDPALPLAERELALRLGHAMAGLGWQAAIHSRAADVAAMDPDAVLCLHPQATPKLTAHPWLACYWNPPALIAAGSETAFHHGRAFELSHDAYLVSGPDLAAHLGGRMALVGRDPPTLPFHVSSPRSHLTPNLGPQSRLFYVGSNWDGRRYPHLLGRLAAAGVLALHGTADRWSHLPDAYQGPLPFDGSAVIAAAHHWGMGLCLHLPSHRDAAVPNMRVFELAAAGAVIIADRHPFIEEWFGDTVLYVDPTGGEAAMADHILDRVAWIKAHPVQARTMAGAAQDIFNRALCLEVLLEPLPDLLAALTRRPAPRQLSSVAVLLPPGGELDGRLAQLAAQAGEGLAVTALLPAGEAPASVPAGLSLRLLDRPAGLPALSAALAGVEMLAILPAGVEWHPGHLAGLLQATGKAGVALAAGLWPRGAGDQGFPIDPAEEWTLPPPPPLTIPEDRLLERAWLRAAGLGCPVARLRELGLLGGDWLQLALNLAPALAARGEVREIPVPSLRLLRPSASGVGPLLPWPERSATGVEQPPRLTGLNDLDPALAASIAFLWRAADFAAVPGTGPIWLYGAGQGGALVLECLPDAVRGRLRGFLDSHRQGDMLGLPLSRPQDIDAADMAAATIIIAAQYVSDILRVLRRGAALPAHILNAYPYIAARLAERPE
ncbi:hypothetical protein GE253_12740 [Niveispirillum sp. SYP-B3756]|uniref:glycosyltransferase n=1 Tax=Niveispirillum sp. SYP-B3756 TaxID=2662178 RepID=UPI0012923118|nr:glycosyltransferase [Niveispirillum sp. SYP-B3756]MQP66207.1 hypothetical protein [Niveispirillum sp. SYP-B3756]